MWGVYLLCLVGTAGVVVGGLWFLSLLYPTTHHRDRFNGDEYRTLEPHAPTRKMRKKVDLFR
jgi:hypothetical protein